MSKKHQPQKAPPQIELIPESEFEDALKQVLIVSKEESDEQMERFQASNRERREQRRRS